MADRFQLGRDTLAKQRKAADEASKRADQRETEEEEDSIRRKVEGFKLTPEEEAELRSKPAPAAAPTVGFRPTPSGTETPETSAAEQNLQAEITARLTTPTAPASGTGTKPGEGDTRVAIKDNLDAIAKRADDLAPADKADFSQDMAELRSWYTKAQDRLENSELVERMAHAFTQLGAGMWGSKHGVDMSGLKFDKADWDKKMDRTLSEFKVRLDELEGRRRESGEERRFSAQQALAKRGQDIGMAESQNTAAFQKRQLEELIRHNKATEGALLAKGTKGTDINKLMAGIDKKMVEARSVFLREKATPEEKNAAAVSILSDAGMTPEEAQEALSTKGLLWGRNQMDPEQALISLGAIAKDLKLRTLANSMGLGGGSGKPKTVTQGGNTYTLNEETGEYE